jgi:hypothetical protein
MTATEELPEVLALRSAPCSAHRWERCGICIGEARLRGGQTMGRQNGAAIGPGRDLREEDGQRKLEHDGVCRRCGRSALAELCRSCSKNPSAPLERAERVVELPRALADAARVRTVEEEPVERSTLEATDVTTEDVVRMVATSKVATDKTCSVAECGVKVLAKGLCTMHYTRVRRAVAVGTGSWDDKAFVARALDGEFAQPLGPKPKAAKQAPKKTRHLVGVAKVVHRDVKPANVVAAPTASDDPAFDILFALRALDAKERAWVLRVANEKWPA